MIKNCIMKLTFCVLCFLFVFRVFLLGVSEKVVSVCSISTGFRRKTLCHSFSLASSLS